MGKKKTIPCRICGKSFEPCAYCQSHGEIFRWRNFACSKECATKYINDAIAYRNSLMKKSEEKTAETYTEKPISVKKKVTKKDLQNEVNPKLESNDENFHHE